MAEKAASSFGALAMKGVVFTELLGMVEERYGFDLADELIETSDLRSRGAYTAVGTYDHRELQMLVVNLARLTGKPAPELLHDFGGHLLSRFATQFPHFFAATSNLFDFVDGVDRHIHVEVRKLYPDAELPSFRTLHRDQVRMELEYRSCRPFAALAEGLILAAARRFRTLVRLERDDRSDASGSLVVFTLEREAAHPQP
jgi:hypothetical protein